VFSVVFFQFPSRKSTLIASKCFNVHAAKSIAARLALRTAFSHGQSQVMNLKGVLSTQVNFNRRLGQFSLFSSSHSFKASSYSATVFRFRNDWRPESTSINSRASTIRVEAVSNK